MTGYSIPGRNTAFCRSEMQTGQAIWHVRVMWQTPQDGMEEEGSAEAPGAGHQYTHALSMLRFPLDKLYDDAGMFPPAMAGKIIVKAKRGAAESEDGFVGVGQAESSAAGSFTRKADSVVPTQAGSAPHQRSMRPRMGQMQLRSETEIKAAGQGLTAPRAQIQQTQLPQTSGQDWETKRASACRKCALLQLVPRMPQWLFLASPQTSNRQGASSPAT